ncbi:outer membrane protein [Rhizobium rosettiformans]|uniref:Porin family protein n=2 Tax=Rhizobium rosettiformans TaxID=1368430 RepID=A0A4S8Q4F2_9HYPH|nr:outer membrane protein [Rhizobium rosettiformans]MBB5275045.1 outer membrane immunogenic protein [Rhizobium rosettiformans]MDR7029258.1 outer membrane immunogenic protein [Rhizobium rosettiformans]MDR7062972.1 outer membrane immunogenic protein [Rhizobium rosettiformans]THV39123.1 porin family protein [Rhizobium rosettiformans W3]
MIKSILLGSAAALAISTSAFAADAIYEAPAEPPVAVETVPQFSWAGGYAGILTGYGWGDGEIEGIAGSEDFDGARFGGFVGYNWDLGNQLVVGLEGDLNYDWNEETVLGQDFDSGLNWSARARVGYAMDRALLYVAGGYTGTNISTDGPLGSDDDTLHGWTIGGGVDYALTDRMFTRVEYRYNDFGSGDLGGTDVDFDQHTVNVGLAVKF